LESGQLQGQPGQREVQGGREGGAVLEPGGGGHHRGPAAGAAPGGGAHGTHVSAELLAHDCQLRLGRASVERRGRELGHWSLSPSDTSSSVSPTSSGMSSAVRRLEPSTLVHRVENRSPARASSAACSASVSGTSRPEVSVRRYWVSPGIANSRRSRARAVTYAGSSQRSPCCRRSSTSCSCPSTWERSSASCWRWAT